MRGENGTPETPDWVPDKPRRCELDCDVRRACSSGACLCRESPQHAAYDSEDHITRGAE